MAAMTVTATQSGSNSIGMLVRVLTGASLTQPGAVANAPSSTTLAITPTANGSWVYGAAQFNGPPVGPNAATTYEFNGSTNFISHFGTMHDIYLRSTNFTTAGTPVTLGDTGGGGFGLALTEILASGSLAEDSSQPAYVGSTSGGAITTASFTPPPGSLLVAMVNWWNTFLGVSDTSSLTWVRRSLTSFGAVYTAAVPGTPPPPTVTVGEGDISSSLPAQGSVSGQSNSGKATVHGSNPADGSLTNFPK